MNVMENINFHTKSLSPINFEIQIYLYGPLFLMQHDVPTTVIFKGNHIGKQPGTKNATGYETTAPSVPSTFCHWGRLASLSTVFAYKNEKL